MGVVSVHVRTIANAMFNFTRIDYKKLISSVIIKSIGWDNTYLVLRSMISQKN